VAIYFVNPTVICHPEQSEGSIIVKTQRPSLPRLPEDKSGQAMGAETPRYFVLDNKVPNNQGCTGDPKNPNVTLNKKIPIALGTLPAAAGGRSNSFLFLTLHLSYFLNVAPLRPILVVSNKAKPMLIY